MVEGPSQVDVDTILGMASTMLGRVSVAATWKACTARWGVKEGDLSNGLGDCLPNWDWPWGRVKSGIGGVVEFSGIPEVGFLD
jgi:hypothetical protein